MAKRTLQDGFSVLHLILILVILGIIGFTGWYVYDSQRKTADTLDKTGRSDPAVTSKTPATSPATPAYAAPAGYRQYESEGLGFSFAYPQEFGEFAEKKEYGATFLATEHLDAYKQHISGRFLLQTYDNGAGVLARKYGPDVTIKGGKVVVVKANGSDIINNKAGDEYRGFDKQTAARQVNDGLQVFTLKGGDEGVLETHLLFEADGKLTDLQLPSFNTGTYAAGDNGPYDEAEYDTLVKNVVDSVRKLN